MANSLLSPIAGFFSGSTVAGIGNFVMWAVIILILIAIGGGIAVYWVYQKQFDKIVIRFEKLGGKWRSTGRFKGMFRRIGKAGSVCLYIPKLKSHLPRPQLQTGENVYWYAIGQDGEWRNFDIEDIDLKLKQLNVQFVDTDMRYANTELELALQNEFNKPGWWQQYGTYVLGFIFIAVAGIFLWLIAREVVNALNSIPAVMDHLDKILEHEDKIISALDNICSTSGLRGAP